MGYTADNLTGRAKARWQIVEVGLDPALRLTDCDVDIEWDGHRWLARGVEFGEIQENVDGQAATFVVPDATHDLFARLLATNGAEALPVKIYMAEFALTSTSAAPDDVTQVFDGEVSTAMKDTANQADRVEFRCGPPAASTLMMIPRRLLASLARRKP